MKGLDTTLKCLFVQLIAAQVSCLHNNVQRQGCQECVKKFPPNCLRKLAQFDTPAEFTLGYKTTRVVSAGVVGGGRRRVISPGNS